MTMVSNQFLKDRQTPFRVLLFSLTLFISGMLSVTDTESRMYRWIDENGEIHYTDQVPPEQIGQGHSTLTKEGFRTDRVPPALTAEELEQAKETERLKAQEAQRIQQQNAADQKLIDTFRTVEDLLLTRNGKIAAVDAAIQVSRDSVRAEQARILAFHVESNALERANQSVPSQLKASINETIARMRSGYADIIEQEFAKDAIRSDFAQKIERFLQIKNLKVPAGLNAEISLDLSQLRPNLAECVGIEQCGDYWARALAYVRTHAESRNEILGPGVLMALQEDSREDRRFTLAWIQRSANEPVYLYLDLQCKNRLTASLVCVNQDALVVRDGFRQAIMDDSGTLTTGQ